MSYRFRSHLQDSPLSSGWGPLTLILPGEWLLAIASRQGLNKEVAGITLSIMPTEVYGIYENNGTHCVWLFPYGWDLC